MDKAKQAAQCNNDAALGFRVDLQRFAEQDPPADPPANNTPPPAEPPPNDPPPANPPADPPNDPPQDTLEYGDFEVPEGFEKLDESLMAEFLSIAKESKLPKEAVQKLINMHGSTIKSVIEAQAATREANYSALMQEIKADPQLGGQKYEENLGRINAVIGKFGGDGDTFHQAIAQLAAYDTAKAKSLYSTMDKIARAAAVESAIVQGDPKPAKNFYPGLPGRK